MLFNNWSHWFCQPHKGYFLEFPNLVTRCPPDKLFVPTSNRPNRSKFNVWLVISPPNNMISFFTDCIPVIYVVSEKLCNHTKPEVDIIVHSPARLLSDISSYKNFHLQHQNTYQANFYIEQLCPSNNRACFQTGVKAVDHIFPIFCLFISMLTTRPIYNVIAIAKSLSVSLVKFGVLPLPLLVEHWPNNYTMLGHYMA